MDIERLTTNLLEKIVRTARGMVENSPDPSLEWFKEGWIRDVVTKSPLAFDRAFGCWRSCTMQPKASAGGAHEAGHTKAKQGWDA